MNLRLRRLNQVLDVFGIVAILWIPDPGEAGWTSLRFRRGSYSANCNGGVRSPLSVRVGAALGCSDDETPAPVRQANDPAPSQRPSPHVVDQVAEAVAAGEPRAVAELRLYLGRQGGDIANWKERWSDFDELVAAVRALRVPPEAPLPSTDDDA